MFERMCLDGRSYNPTACLQKLNDNDSCIRIEALWLVEHLEVCLGEGAKERNYLFWTFIVQELQQDTFSPGPQGKCLIRGDIRHDSLTAVFS